MAKDVDAALHTIVEQNGGKSVDEAREYIDALKKKNGTARTFINGNCPPLSNEE